MVKLRPKKRSLSWTCKNDTNFSASFLETVRLEEEVRDEEEEEDEQI